jgi:predicted nucleotidyltransferase component of viral defense system
VLFQTEIGNHLVFKGGTSLSKGWNIIERFSEDIDLAVDRSFFGFEGSLGKNQRDKLRKKSKAYISIHPDCVPCPGLPIFCP